MWMLLYCSSHQDSSSLDSMCNVLADCFNIQMSKQSLDERFTKPCLAFVKSVLSEALKDQFQRTGMYKGDFWNHFPRVIIKDSTKFKVPDNMYKDYRGNGGSKAGICIQYEYNLATNEILNLEVGSGGCNDRTNAVKTCDQAKTGDLILRDLGYYSLEVFDTFRHNGVFFLSRLYSKTCVYEDTEGVCPMVDFKKIHKQMSGQNISQMEMKVTLGATYRVPVRMILSLVDEQVYQKRIREREKENRKRGRQMSQEVRLRFRFNIYITNAPEELLPIEQVFLAYRLRWQIELIFKCWKSLYKIHWGRNMKQNRYLCMLYAKLLLIVINLQITSGLQLDIYKIGKDGNKLFLSTYKVLNTLRKYFTCLYFVLTEKGNNAKAALLFLQQKMSQNHWLEKKKNKQTNEIINRIMF
jgi:Transposase DDE domain.